MKIVRKILAIVLIILLLVVIYICSGLYKKIQNWNTNNKRNSITNYIEFSRYSSLDSSGDRASSYVYTVIDINSHKVYAFSHYEIYDKSIFFLEGDHYSYIDKGDISEEKTNEIIDWFNNYIVPNTDESDSSDVGFKKYIRDWYVVNYNGKKKTIMTEDAKILSDYTYSIKYNTTYAE